MSQTVKVIKTVATEILGLIVLIPSSIAWGRDATLIKTSNYSYLATWVLLKAGADANASGQDLLTPLHCAALRGNAHTIQMLIDNKADVNATDHRGQNPLHCAALRGNAHTIQMLIDLGANVNATDDLGETPLHLATRRGDAGIFQMLIDLGADVNATDQNGFSPLLCSLLKEILDKAQILLENKADFAPILKWGQTDELKLLRQIFSSLDQKSPTQSFTYGDKQVNANKAIKIIDVRSQQSQNVST